MIFNIHISPHRVDTGTLVNAYGIYMLPQVAGSTINRGIWLAGDGIGSDISLGVTASDFQLYSDGTNGVIDCAAELRIGSDGGVTDYSKIEADGTLEFNGAATVWEDQQIDIGAVRLPASESADIVEYLSGLAIKFTNAQTNRVSFNMQIPHARKDDSAIEFHVHVTPGTSTNAGNVRWEFEYEWENIDGVYGSSTTVNQTQAMDGTAHKHQYEDIATLTGTGKSSISSILICTLTRLGSDALDTFTGDVYAVGIDFHIEKNMVGSRLETTK